MTEKEITWLKKRAGKITSSNLSKLMTKGKKGVIWGDTAISYLYEVIYEMTHGYPVRNDDNANFRWGREQEPMAIEWLRRNTLYKITHCSIDFPETRFTSGGITGFGDSLDFLANDNMIGEIKCVKSQGKFEKLSRSTKSDVVSEYAEQFAGHFLGNPDSDKLIYFVYDGQSDEDEVDNLDPMDPKRGIIFEYTRDEFSGLIDECNDRINEAYRACVECANTAGKLEQILNDPSYEYLTQIY